MKKTISQILKHPVSRVLTQTVIIAGITFALTEITFRIYNKINPSFVFRDRSYNRWRGKPNARDFNFNLNSHGFKDVEFTQEKPPGTHRILGIGDSFAFGIVPYHDNYLTLVEDGLNAEGKTVELINMGIPGMGPEDYLSLLTNEGLILNPDRIILSFYIGNDFIDNYLLSLEKDEEIFYTVAFLKSLMALNAKFQGTDYNPQNLEYDDDKPTLTDEAYREIVVNASRMFDIEATDGMFLSMFEDAMRDIREIKRICDSRNIDLSVVIIPAEVQVDPNLQAEVIQTFKPDDPDGFDFEYPNRLLRDRFEEYDIDYIDLLDDFREASQTDRLYRPNDTHWNIAGNRLAAELIERHLLKQNLETEAGSGE
ncbi:MAG: alginate O-acetyltransferase AlgX-related protein [Limnospira sp.]